MKVFNVNYFNKEDELIDSTQIDERNEKLAWDLFKEFGHKKEKGFYLKFDEVEEELSDSVTFGNVEVVIEGKRDWNEDYDFGTLTLACEDREFKMDVVQSYTNDVGDGNTRITLDIEPDEELFEDCPYNLTKEDLLDCEHNDLTREIFIGGTFSNKIISIDLFFEVDGQDYQLKLERD